MRRGLLVLLPILLGAAGARLVGHGYLAAVRPGLDAADRDGDGRLGPDELARSSPGLARFRAHDLDHDGTLDEAELLGLLLAQDPSQLENEAAPRQPTPMDHLQGSTDPPAVRRIRVLFQFMVAEVLAVDRRVALPSDEQIAAAAATGTLDSPESRAMAANLVAAYQICHLEIPLMFAAVTPTLAEPGLRITGEPEDRPDHGRRGANPQPRSLTPEGKGPMPPGPPPGPGPGPGAPGGRPPPPPREKTR